MRLFVPHRTYAADGPSFIWPLWNTRLFSDANHYFFFIAPVIPLTISWLLVELIVLRDPSFL